LQILTLNPEDQNLINQAASILFEGFQEIWPNICPDIQAALEVVQKTLLPDRICRIALADNGLVLGWIAAVPDYDGNAWCLYPLAVHPDYRERGIGRALVNDLETQVRERGAITLYLGTDDTAGMTTLGNTNLYPNVLDHIANIKNLRRHPYEFYQKLGFSIVGVIPDANGLGKPDIIMARSLVN
jgi:aminoglycoside 6'-N-acetyltransferase I